eukprot:4820290-Pyramimonas_sp.AAC.1
MFNNNNNNNYSNSSSSSSNDNDNDNGSRLVPPHHALRNRALAQDFFTMYAGAARGEAGPTWAVESAAAWA